jgi:HPt (histidine-containing phosphotransfer) domain-containing protein
MLARLAGDRELARQLAGIFIGECPRMLGAVREGLDQGSADAVRRAAHALKGSVLNFVDGGAAATASALEQMGRAGDLQGAGAALAQLETELTELIDRLRDFEAKDA